MSHTVSLSEVHSPDSFKATQSSAISKKRLSDEDSQDEPAWQVIARASAQAQQDSANKDARIKRLQIENALLKDKMAEMHGVPVEDERDKRDKKKQRQRPMPNGCVLNAEALGELLGHSPTEVFQDGDDDESHTTYGVGAMANVTVLTTPDGIHVKIPYTFGEARDFALLNVKRPNKVGDKAIVTHGMHRGQHVKIEGFTKDGKHAFVSVENMTKVQKKERGITEKDEARQLEAGDSWSVKELKVDICVDDLAIRDGGSTSSAAVSSA